MGSDSCKITSRRCKSSPSSIQFRVARLDIMALTYASPVDYLARRIVDYQIDMPSFPVTENIGCFGPSVRCKALRYLPQGEGEPPQLYDKALINAMLEGSREELEKMVHNSRIANAQSHTGETLLMKVCRQVMSFEGTHRSWVLELLLERGADTMVCCDAGKNVLHDLFWSALPPPASVLQAMEDVITMLHKAAGKRGLLELMLCKDRQGFSPADYIKPEQTNWKSIMDRILDTARDTEGSKRPRQEDESAKNIITQTSPCKRPRRELCEQRKRTQMQQRFCGLSSLRTGIGRKTAADILACLDPRPANLLVKLDKMRKSFLLSDMSDPNAIIVAASDGFCELTGYAMEEVLGQNCRFLQGPDTDYNSVLKIQAALSKTLPLHVRILNYHKDGTPFLNNFVLLPLSSNRKNLYYVGIQDCPREIIDAFCIEDIDYVAPITGISELTRCTQM